MTTYLGRDGLGLRRSAHTPGTSANLDAGVAPFTSLCGVAIRMPAAPGRDADGSWQHFPSFVHWGESGHCGFTNTLWEKILVLPREFDAGHVLSDTTWEIEVWNTHRAQARTLTGIGITGVGSLEILGPTAMTYWPGQFQPYTATLPGQGDATILNLATWTFPGEAGIDMAVTGLRVAVFPFRPDWSEPFREAPSWLTEVLPAYDATEQRRSLRQRPRYSLAYRVTTTDPLESASLEALLYGWQSRQFGVPIWPESTPLLADLNPGDTALAADTTDRPTFAADGLVMIWSGYASWEAFRVGAVLPGSISLGSQVTRPWSAGARVVPIRRGHLQDDQPMDRPANWLSSGDFAFTCEAT